MHRCTCVHVFMRVCVHGHVGACARACACVCVCVCACVPYTQGHSTVKLEPKAGQAPPFQV